MSMMQAKTSAWEITEAMIIYGGSFVQGLGRLWRQADAVNQAKLLTAFRDYFEKYDEIAFRRPTRFGGQPPGAAPEGDR